MIDMNELGYSVGLKSFDTALPQHWVDAMLELTKKMTGRERGIYPYGFVWSYDNSSIFGEPYPLTERARLYALFVGIHPRDGSLDNVEV